MVRLQMETTLAVLGQRRRSTQVPTQSLNHIWFSWIDRPGNLIDWGSINLCRRFLHRKLSQLSADA